MSQSDSGSYEREVAVRVFASELLDATYEFKENEGEMEPNYTLLPTGQRANRILVFGTLIATAEREYSQGSQIHARVSDGEGIFYITASQYEQQVRRKLQDLESPEFVGIVGKIDHYSNREGEDKIEIQPEAVMEVPENDRDVWVKETIADTVERLKRYRTAEEGDEPIDVKMAKQQYDVDLDSYIEHAEAVEEMVLEE